MRAFYFVENRSSIDRVGTGAIEPLHADPKRQADAMLRGCEYQIWQTVAAWLDLKPEEVLFVEGAEDFDLVGPNGAVAAQVKVSDQPLSLGRADVIEAVNNYWKLQKVARDTRPFLRFLARGAASVEQGAPFGANTAGLDVWMRSKTTDSEVLKISEVLQKHEKLSTEVRDWLKRAGAQEIRENLIERISWETQSESVERVERGVHRRLDAYAETQRGVPVLVSKRVARRLFDEVWKVLRKTEDRAVDRLRFKELWDEETRVSVPQAAADTLLAGLAGMGVPAPRLIDQLRVGAPPLPKVVAQRNVLVGDIRLQLATGGFMNIHGSTRMGKTTLAKLAIAPDSSDWRWWSATGRSLEEVGRSIGGLTKEWISGSLGNSLVLDDLDFSPLSTKQFEDDLVDLIATVRARRGRILVTSQKPLPTRLQHLLAVTQEQVLTVPKLTRMEVQEFATALGCPADQRLEKWSTIVYARTDGHPQLAAVHLLCISQRGWPLNTEFSTGVAEVDAEKADARQLLAELPDAQRSLLHRLSVFPRMFRRDHAVAIGAEPPPLANPGDLFDPLVGPWVEPLHEGYFALSPLISGCAREVLAVDDFRNMQVAAAGVLVDLEPRTTFEGAMAFQLLWSAKEEGALVALTSGWVGMKEELFAALAEDLWWFTYVSTEPGQILYPSTYTGTSHALRLIQFRVAMATDVSRAAQVVAAWRWEVDQMPGEENLLNRFLFAMQVVPYYQVPLPGKLVVELLECIETTLQTYPELKAELPAGAHIPGDAYLPPSNDLISTLSYFTSQRCTNIQFLDEFVTALEGISAELRGKILLGFRGSGAEVQLALDRAWLDESDREAPDWKACLGLFERIFELGLAWDFKELALAAMRGIAVILDEYLHDRVAAHAAIERLGERVGKDTHQVYDRRASVYFSEGNFAKAEDNWRLALARWPEPNAPFDSSSAFAARSAGVSAAKQGRWEAAAEWFLEILKRLPKPNSVRFVAAAYADSSYAFWKAGLHKRAIESLVRAWEAADQLPLGKTDIEAFKTRKLVGHVIAWIHEESSQIGGILQTEPLPGMCSSAETPEKILDLPEGDNDGVWVFLQRLERKYQAGDRAEQIAGNRIRASGSPQARGLAHTEKITKSLTTGDLTSLVTQLIELAAALKAAAAATPATPLEMSGIDSNVFQRNDGLLGTPLFLAALISAAAREQSISDLLAKWRASALMPPHGLTWSTWFDEIDATLNLSSTDAAARLRRTDSPWSESLLAAVNVLISLEGNPEDIFYAQARWLLEVSASPWMKDVGPDFCRLIERDWLRAVVTPALFRTPRISVPAIQEACAAEEPSLKKAVSILRAAQGAVSTRISPAMWDLLAKL